MVRSVSSLSSNNSGNLVLSSMLKSGKNSAKNSLKSIAKHVDLPAKMALGATGIYGASKVIGDSMPQGTFLMTCSSYECDSYEAIYCDLNMFGP